MARSPLRARIGSALSRLLNRDKPIIPKTPPKINTSIGGENYFRSYNLEEYSRGGGHYGLALGLAGNEQLKEEMVDVQDVPSNISEDMISRFLSGRQILFVHSSNVRSLLYQPANQELIIEFLAKGKRPVSAYAYSNISLEEAAAFAKSLSKGSTVWSLLRVRGSRTAHRKPYKRIR